MPAPGTRVSTSTSAVGAPWQVAVPSRGICEGDSDRKTHRSASPELRAAVSRVPLSTAASNATAEATCNRPKYPRRPQRRKSGIPPATGAVAILTGERLRSPRRCAMSALHPAECAVVRTTGSTRAVPADPGRWGWAIAASPGLMLRLADAHPAAVLDDLPAAGYGRSKTCSRRPRSAPRNVPTESVVPRAG